MTLVASDNTASRGLGSRGLLLIADRPFGLALATFAMALAWATIAHAPYFGYDFAVDGFYDAGAHLWVKGVLPYVGVFDVKPPGFFALLAGAQLVLGPGPAAVQTVAIVFDALGATALFFIGRRLGSSPAGALAAALYPVLTQFLPQECAYSPFDAFVILAALAALTPMAPARRALLAGLAIGAAASIKQTAVIDGAAIMAGLLLMREASGQRVRLTLSFGAGVAAIPLAILALYWAQGAARPLVEDVVTHALERPGAEGFGFGFGLVLTLRRLAPLAPLFALACWPSASADDARVRLVRLWFFAALAGLVLQRALYNCYLGPLLAPCLLLAALRAQALPLPTRFPSWGRALALGVVALAFLPLRMNENFVKPHDDRAIAGAVAAIRGANPGPDDKLFVVDYGRWLYSATDLAPPTPFILPMHFLCEFPNAGPRRLAEALALKPRFVVVGTYQGIRSECRGVEAWPLVTQALAGSYHPLSEIKGDRETYAIYEAGRP